MLGAVDLLVENRHVLEEPQQVDLLLVVHPHEIVIGLSRDGQDRSTVHLGIVETVEQVDRSGAAGGNAHAQAAGELGIAACHERRAFLMPAPARSESSRGSIAVLP